MKFIYRIGFYLGGFSIGIIFLVFFFSGKKTSCDYGPSSRVLKNINSKKIKISQNVIDLMSVLKLDTITVNNILKDGSVVFSESQPQLEGCKIYTIKKNEIKLIIENCKKLALVKEIIKLN